MISNLSVDLQPNSFRSLFLFVVTLGNYALMYLANIVLARSLTVSAFDDYSVALSVVTILNVGDFRVGKICVTCNSIVPRASGLAKISWLLVIFAKDNQRI